MKRLGASGGRLACQVRSRSGRISVSVSSAMMPRPSATTCRMVPSVRRAQARDAEAPRPAPRAQQREPAQHEPRQRARGGHRRGEPAEHRRAEAEVLRLATGSARDDGAARRVSDHPAAARQPELAPQHAQRRHLAQVDERRQREAEQQQQAHRRRRAAPGPGRARAARRRRPRPARRARSACAAMPTSMPTAAASEPSIVKCSDVQPRDAGLARAEAAHHGAAVEMALEIAPRGERDRRRREQHARERGEIEEFLGALERGADLGPRVAYALDALSRREPRRWPTRGTPRPPAASPAICRR